MLAQEHVSISRSGFLSIRRPAHWLVWSLVFGLGATPSAAAEGDADAQADAVVERAQSAVEAAPLATADTAPGPEEIIYDRVQVVGGVDGIQSIPGAAHVVGAAELERYGYTDIHRVLRRVPGLNIQEEDGLGLRPNIGIRGTGVERSQKILLLEDGVPIAPAPYSAPAAYYSPTAGRMEAIEVRKGTASIRQGPLTTGGAINYVSTSIPQDLSGRVDVSGGDHGTVKIKAHVGATYENVSFVAETFQHTTDGFKSIDGGGGTGFEIEDYLVKLRLTSDAGASIYQALEIKAGHTVQDGRETYLGLTRADFDADPNRRYRGSQEDRIDTDHDQIQLRYFVQPTANLDVTTTVYRNDFFRNWRKNESTLGIRNDRILDDPLRYATELAVLRGDSDSADDAIRVRNNRRDYFSQGVQSTVAWHLDAGSVVHGLRFGFRFHRDEEDRFQEEDGFAMRGGQMVLTSFGAPGSQANRISEAEALALFVEDEVAFGRWAITPGVRFETIDTNRTDYSRTDPERSGPTSIRSNEIDVVIPGLGVTYEARPDWHVFGSVHRGFSAPSPSSRPPVDAEESVNWEFGTRWRKGRTQLEAVAFFNDYDNLLGSDTLSGGGTGTGDQFNGGAVEVFGLELSYATDLFRGDVLGGTVRVPFRIGYTFTRGEFQSNFETGFADWAPEVRRGDALPYLPEQQLFVELGFERDAWSVFLNTSLVDEMRTTAGQGPVAEPDRIEGHIVADLAGSVRFLDRFRVYAQVRNVTDEVYVVARRPYGLRPGLPRTALAGIAVSF